VRVPSLRVAVLVRQVDQIVRGPRYPNLVFDQQCDELLSVQLNMLMTLFDATRIILFLARESATVSRRGASRNSLERRRNCGSLSVAPTRMTVRSSPWERSAARMLPVRLI
jgi:hypothetical protein